MVSRFGSLRYTIMGKTSDPTVVQKTIIDTLHKEDKDNFGSHLTKTHQIIRPIKKHWPSGKYVHLLYMYSILGRGSFCFNYCLNSAWRGGDQFVALLRWYESPGFFDSGFQLICIFLVSCFSFSSWQYSIDSLGFRSGEFAGQSSTPTPWSFYQCFVLLAVWAGAKSCWKMKSASLKSWSAEVSMKCSNISW